MPEPRDLDTVLADWREKATVLRSTGHANDAKLILKMATEVAEATEEWRRFLSEKEARVRSGKSVEWLRGRFAQWEQEGHAEKRGRERYYRACVLPRRADLIAAREAGRRGDVSAVPQQRAS